MQQDDVLAENLRRRNVPYLSGGSPQAPPLNDAALVAGLLCSENARVRHALVAWLLLQPNIHAAVPTALAGLPSSTAFRLQVLYSAAVRLQSLHQHTLRPFCAVWLTLPDMYADALPAIARTDDPDASLRALAGHCAAQWGTHINWHGTFDNIATTLLQHLARERAWANT